MSRPDSTPLPERLAARVLVFDAAGRVLLLQGWDPTEPWRGWWWHTPGGGVETGESPVEAGVRELAEETGLVLDAGALIGPVYTQEFRLRYMGLRAWQREVFFAGWVDAAVAADLDTGGRTAIERDCLGEARWWSATQLRATSEVVYPSALLTIMADLHRGAC